MGSGREAWAKGGLLCPLGSGVNVRVVEGSVAATFRGDSLQSPHFTHPGGVKRWTIDKTPVAAAPVRLRLRHFGVP